MVCGTTLRGTITPTPIRCPVDPGPRVGVTRLGVGVVVVVAVAVVVGKGAAGAPTTAPRVTLLYLSVRGEGSTAGSMRDEGRGSAVVENATAAGVAAVAGAACVAAVADVAVRCDVLAPFEDAVEVVGWGGVIEQVVAEDVWCVEEEEVGAAFSAAVWL